MTLHPCFQPASPQLPNPTPLQLKKKEKKKYIYFNISPFLSVFFFASLFFCYLSSCSRRIFVERARESLCQFRRTVEYISLALFWIPQSAGRKFQELALESNACLHGVGRYILATRGCGIGTLGVVHVYPTRWAKCLRK